MRHRSVRVPATSGNLGPGYDVLGCALEVYLHLDVTESGSFSLDAGTDAVPTDRSNLLVRAFERLHPADRVSFRVRSEIPLSRGLGSSASAILAGLMAADHMFELGNSTEQIFALATEIEGHPDNVAAALYGGVTICPPPGVASRGTPPDPIEIAIGGASDPASPPIRLDPPNGVEGVLVIPGEEVSTERARAAMPAEVPVADAAFNVAAATHLAIGIERSDLTMIERGLNDRLHQPYRRPLYESSMEIVERARDAGALGATISGAGPTVLVWCEWQGSGKIADRLASECEDWAEVRRAPFSPLGATVEL